MFDTKISRLQKHTIMITVSKTVYLLSFVKRVGTPFYKKTLRKGIKLNYKNF